MIPRKGLLLSDTDRARYCFIDFGFTGLSYISWAGSSLHTPADRRISLFSDRQHSSTQLRNLE